MTPVYTLLDNFSINLSFLSCTIYETKSTTHNSELVKTVATIDLFSTSITPLSTSITPLSLDPQKEYRLDFSSRSKTDSSTKLRQVTILPRPTNDSLNLSFKVTPKPRIKPSAICAEIIRIYTKR